MIPSDEFESSDRTEFTQPVKVGSPNKPAAVAAVRPYQLNVTGSQLLMAAAFALCLASLSLCLVRYWLFAR